MLSARCRARPLWHTMQLWLSKHTVATLRAAAVQSMLCAHGMHSDARQSLQVCPSSNAVTEALHHHAMYLCKA